MTMLNILRSGERSGRGPSASHVAGIPWRAKGMTVASELSGESSASMLISHLGEIAVTVLVQKISPAARDRGGRLWRQLVPIGLIILPLGKILLDLMSDA